MKCYDAYDSINEAFPELNERAKSKGFNSLSAMISELHWWEKDVDEVARLLPTIPIR